MKAGRPQNENRGLIAILGGADSSWHHGQSAQQTGNYLNHIIILRSIAASVAMLEESASPRVGIRSEADLCPCRRLGARCRRSELAKVAGPVCAPPLRYEFDCATVRLGWDNLTPA